ncbi:hypothetical protein CAPTEDRAFT_191081 [Capitella teleta]|uniref:Uncharacterized protein n=1 Tax=Capitella teleta TaxID=283909 RepID=R7URC8_CAPTE|nr:hypothetical protein CAPTEDRAFT_191081 [Capitella teleta]|eukprot:ELU06482.1 hypothetical protein CAPTEDRAFT_191081 [Capitella teleta]
MKVHMLTALVLVQLFQGRCKFFTCNDGSCTNDMRTCDGELYMIELRRWHTLPFSLAKHLTPCREGERMCKDGTCQNVELDCACEKACLFGRCVKSYASCTDYDVNPEETAEGKETPILVRTLAEIKRKAALNRIEACIPTYQFQCLKGATPCVFTFDVCDGYDDCDDGSDEFDCETCTVQRCQKTLSQKSKRQKSKRRPIANGPIAKGPIANGPIANGPLAKGPISGAPRFLCHSPHPSR